MLFFMTIMAKGLEPVDRFFTQVFTKVPFVVNLVSRCSASNTSPIISTKNNISFTSPCIRFQVNIVVPVTPSPRTPGRTPKLSLPIWCSPSRNCVEKHDHQDDHNHYNDDFHTATKVLLSVSFIRDIGCHKVDENCINYYK